MDNRAPKKRRVEPGRGAGAAAGAAGAKKKERWQFDGRPNFAAEPFKAGPRSKVSSAYESNSTLPHSALGHSESTCDRGSERPLSL